MDGNFKCISINKVNSNNYNFNYFSKDIYNILNAVNVCMCVCSLLLKSKLKELIIIIFEIVNHPK